MPSKGLGGVAATTKYVLVSGRELMDTADSWMCHDAETGKELWKVIIPAAAERELDYGNTPRATPLIVGKQVILSGAFGQVQCVDLATGDTIWDKDLKEDFAANDVRKWGMCSSPLLADDKLILNPGGKDASLVALDPKTGKVLWKSPGKPASYGNFIFANLGGKKQLVGFDADSLGGWDVADGKRLWRLEGERKAEFHVPTPMVVGEKLLVAWENNGTKRFRFGKEGRIEEKPEAHYAKLAPDTHTPVVTAGRVFGAWNGLHCLKLENLESVWLRRDAVFQKYLALVASEERVLAITFSGELILFDAKSDSSKEVNRLKIIDDADAIYAHPAIIGTRIYLRGENELLCVELAL
jgi:outer membrane protein assembly factor BamB